MFKLIVTQLSIFIGHYNLVDRNSKLSFLYYIRTKRCLMCRYFSSVQLLSHIWLFAIYGLQHTRLPSPSPTPGVYSNSCPLSRWCHPTISSSVILFSCPQSFPASGSFPMNQFFASGSKSIGASASASVLPMNIQDWFPLWLTSLILKVKGLSGVFSNATTQKVSILWRSAFFMVQLPPPYMTTRENIALTLWTFVSKVMSLLFKMLSRCVVALLLRSQVPFNIMAAVTICNDFGVQENKVCQFPLFPHQFAMKRWDWTPWF